MSAVGCLHRVPMDIQHHPDAGILGQIVLYALPGLVIGIGVGGVIVHGPVVDHLHAAVLQDLGDPIPHRYHIVIGVQGAIAGGFLVVLGFLIAFCAVGVNDQHRRPILGQIPL